MNLFLECDQEFQFTPSSVSGDGTVGPPEQAHKKPPQDTAPSRDATGPVPGPCCGLLCHSECCLGLFSDSQYVFFHNV